MASAGMAARQSPCPHRCFDDLGSAFAMGCMGGAAWHGFKGMRNAPRGARLQGGYQQIVLRAPALGGNFAVWGGLFSFFDCSITYMRQKEDPLNAVSAGFLTGGVLAIRAGPKAAFMNAMIGGCLLGMIEGVSFLFGRYSEGPTHAPPVPGLAQSQQSPFGGPAGGPRNLFANLQPQRTLTTALDDPTAQYLSLDDEDTSKFISQSATRPDEASSSSSSSSSSRPSLFFPDGQFLTSKKKPVYAQAVEFSSDDFAFNDSEDFEDDQQ